MKAILEDIVRSDNWVAANIRKKVTEYPDLPPFTTWFKPESAVEIMAGELLVLSAFSMKSLLGLFAQKGIKASYEIQPADFFPIHITSKHMEEQTEFEFLGQVGEWQHLKMLYSFLALESFVDIYTFLTSPEATKQMKSKIASMASNPPAKS